MESNTSSSSLDNAEAKTAFRKPSNDTGSRHYRRRSPVGGSSSSEGLAEERDRGSSPIHSREESRRDTDSVRSKVDERDLDRDSGRIQHGRSGDTYRQSDRKFSKSSYNDRRRNTYDRRDKVTDVEERYYSKSSSQFGRESRSSTRSDHAREENDSYKFRHHSHRDDKYSRDERREYRRGDNKDSRSSVHGSGSLRDKAGHRLKDPQDLDGQKYAKEEKRKLSDQETRNQMDGSNKHPRKQFKEGSVFTSENEDSPAKQRKPVSLVNEGKSLKHSLEPSGKVNSEQAPASGCNAADIDAARITALKAAESVNKNLMGTGYMSADQKKKLLWGNKKSTPVEEQSIHRWDTATFSDREQQEKFNKLMSLRFGWYIWPIVGCEGGSKSGSQTQRSKEWCGSLRETEGSAARLGEAICCWPSSERWSYCWTWSLTFTTSLGCFCSCTLSFSVTLCFYKILWSEVTKFLFLWDKRTLSFSSYLLD